MEEIFLLIEYWSDFLFNLAVEYFGIDVFLFFDDFGDMMAPLLIFLKKFLESGKAVAFMQSEEGALCAYMNFFFNAYYIQWFSMQQTHALFQTQPSIAFISYSLPSSPSFSSAKLLLDSLSIALLFKLILWSGKNSLFSRASSLALLCRRMASRSAIFLGKCEGELVSTLTERRSSGHRTR